MESQGLDSPLDHFKRVAKALDCESKGGKDYQKLCRFIRRRTKLWKDLSYRAREEVRSMVMGEDFASPDEQSEAAMENIAKTWDVLHVWLSEQGVEVTKENQSADR